MVDARVIVTERGGINLVDEYVESDPTLDEILALGLVTTGTDLKLTDTTVGTIDLKDVFKVRVSGLDTFQEHLEDKIEAGAGITIAKITDSIGAEYLSIAALGVGTDELAKVTSNDTTAGYLFDKIIGTTNKITVTEVNDAGDEDLQINVGTDIFDKTVDDTDDITEGTTNLFYTNARVETYLNTALVGGDNITITLDSFGVFTFDLDAGVDVKDVKVSANDTTADFLVTKLVSGANITITELNDGLNETLSIAATTPVDEKVRVSSNDGVTDYLINKITGGDGIVLTEINDGGDEDLDIDLDISTLTNDAGPLAGTDEFALDDGTNNLKVTLTVLGSSISSFLDESVIDHDSLLNFVADEHVAHSGVSVVAGGDDALLVAQNDLTANIGLKVDIFNTTTIAPVTTDFLLFENAAGGTLGKATIATIVGAVSGNAFDTITGNSGGPAVADSASDSLAIVGDATGGIVTVAADGPESITISIDISTLATAGVISSGDFFAVDQGGGANFSVDHSTLETSFNHDNLTGFVGNEHIDHTGVSVILASVSGLAVANNDLSANIDLELDISTLAAKVTLVGTDEFGFDDGTAANQKITVTNLGDQISNFLDESAIDHDALLNFVADEHVAHTGVSVVAGGDDALATTNNDLSSNIGLTVDIVGTTAETTISGNDLVLIHEDGAGALRSMTYTNFVAGIVTTDELVGVSANDTTPGYLLDKITSTGSSLTITEVGDGGDEDINLEVDESNVDHDSLQNFVANEHIDHSGVSVLLNATSGLTVVTDNLTADIDLELDISTLAAKVTLAGTDEFAFDDGTTANQKITVTNLGDQISNFLDESAIDHDALLNFVANEHIDHSSVSVLLNATSGLTVVTDNLTADIDLELDISTLAAKVTLVGTDEFAFDDGTTANQKITVTNLGDQISNFLDESAIDHDALLNFVANEHVDHTSVSVVAGGDDALAFTNNDLSSNIGLTVDIVGTTAETTISAADLILIHEDGAGALRSMTFANFTAGLMTTDELVGVSANDTTPGFLLDKLTSTGSSITLTEVGDGGDEDLNLEVNEANVDHDSLQNFVANEHIDHSTISVLDTDANHALSVDNDDLSADIALAIDLAEPAGATPVGADLLLFRDANAGTPNLNRTASISSVVSIAIGGGLWNSIQGDTGTATALSIGETLNLQGSATSGIRTVMTAGSPDNAIIIVAPEKTTAETVLDEATDIFVFHDDSQTAPNTLRGITFGNIVTQIEGVIDLSIDDLNDVDTTTSAPSTGDLLEWDGSDWVPVAPNIFGTEYVEAINTATASTTSTTPVQRLTINPTGMTASFTYRVEWSYQWRYTNTSNDFMARVDQNNGTILMTHDWEAKDSSTTQRGQAGGYVLVTGLAGSNTFDLDWWSEVGSQSAFIYNAHLSFWRVS